jgi:hypothetical protein
MYGFLSSVLSTGISWVLEAVIPFKEETSDIENGNSVARVGDINPELTVVLRAEPSTVNLPLRNKGPYTCDNILAPPSV